MCVPGFRLHGQGFGSPPRNVGSAESIHPCFVPEGRSARIRPSSSAAGSAEQTDMWQIPSL